MSKPLLLITEDDKEFVPQIRSCFGAEVPYVSTKKIPLLINLLSACRSGGITKVICTDTDILSKLLHLRGNPKTKPSLEDYAGSFFRYEELEIVFINPLRQLFTKPFGKFIADRFISKLVSPEKWREPTAFTFGVVDRSNVLEYYERFKNALFIAPDIETLRQNLAIRCIGYTAVFLQPDGKLTTESIVLPMKDGWSLHWMRKFNSLDVSKVTQNGKYDNAYLLRFNAPLYKWVGDTAHFMHATYSELPKDLAFLNAFHLREVVYWKDLAETSDLYEYYRYNALDTWATANVWIQQLLTAPSYALKNYLLAFPLAYPCLLSECTGILRDDVRLERVKSEVQEKINFKIKKLQYITNSPTFNTNSSKQVKALLKVLTGQDWESSDEKHMAKAMYLHPFNNVVLQNIIDVRGLRKLDGTYLLRGEETKDYRGTFFYSLNPHGTGTGRLSSGESAFWCGANVQNIPAGYEVKYTLKAPDGFYLAEADLEQAESRDTAFITGDPEIIRAVSSDRDFHSINASNMSGVPYEEIYDDRKKKPKNKILRTGFKRVNHGANYNMSFSVLVDSMGYELVYATKKLLRLPFFSAEEICEHLLVRFHQTYKRLKGHTTIRHKSVLDYNKLHQSEYKLYAPETYYAKIAEEVKNTGRITSRAFHHTDYNLKHYDLKEYIEEGDWTRVCFGKPWEKKLDLNGYVAHPPQSLNARTLNEAVMKVFYTIALPYAEHFRLYAQIHDSILHGYRQGWEWLSDKVKECMEIPVTVRDVFGEYHTFTVPAALKQGSYAYNEITGNPVVDDFGNHYLKRAVYWSDTE